MPAVNYGRKLDCLRKRVKGSESLPEEGRELLFEFWRDLEANDYSKARIYKLINTLTIIGERMEASFEEANSDDIKDLIAWVNSRDLSKATKTDYRIIIKRFYKWLNGGKEYPECVEWIRTTLNGKKNKILPKDMLREEDVRDLIDAAHNSRDRALVALLWETGARIGEILDAKVGDTEEHKHGKMIIIDGKTGPRRLPLISSAPHMRSWLTGHHPRGNDRDAPLFVNVHSNPGERMKHRSVLKTLNDLAERAGIGKPVNPHHFRHSRATYLASRFTEAQMCEWFGWVQGSDQPQRYIHLSGRDIDSDYAAIHGIKEEEEPEKSILTPEGCPRCEEKNDPAAIECQKCGLPLDEETALALEGEDRFAEKLMERVLKTKFKGNTFKEMVKGALEEILDEQQEVGLHQRADKMREAGA